MAPTDRYPFAKSMMLLCRALRIDPQRVLRRAGMPPDMLEHEQRGATARQVFDLWRAAEAELRRPEMAFDLAMATARGQFVPAVFAFACSPTVQVGLERLSLFKPLAGPFRLMVARQEAGLLLGFGSVDPAEPLPDSLLAFELIFLVNLIRNQTGEEVVPRRFTLPAYPGDPARLARFLGTEVTYGNEGGLLWSDEVARLPLISHDDDLWAMFEPHLQSAMVESGPTRSTAKRVRAALVEMLPAGRATSGALASHLGMSTRSLHRRLKQEGESFQSVLNATRTELSLHYLRQQDISIEEISYLLAFRDPNSFYRAFRGWTGMTPGEIRGQRTH
ncbi:AraC family transcriptional regulator [Nioella nitratireducens]|uniref:AraC family transcriptional regulator n=1 Tax=Nioella nitratireducens TaxID=1287720 RepID=UPI0008FD6114|nr:AraC family transcriptional regulator [Nioella nitratireducens]